MNKSIENLKKLKSFHNGSYGADIDKAIKALEQEPCEDCISRTQAIKAMDDLENEDIEAYGCSIPEGFDGERARQAICLLPSIQLKPKAEVINKIKAEIDRQEKWLMDAGYSAYNVDIALDAIKSVVAESGDKI